MERKPLRIRVTRLQLALISIAAAIFLCSGLGLAYQAIMTRLDQQAYPPEGELYTVNGLAMHLYCEGHPVPGKPAVIIAPGLGNNVLVWTYVVPVLGKHTLACAYDRPGMGWSEPTQAPRDSATIAGELHALLEVAGVEPPYVLVAQSMSGLHARVFTGLYPDEVVGMVLLDGWHPDQQERLPEVAAGAAEQRRRLQTCMITAPLGLVRLVNAAHIPGLPEDLETIQLSLGAQNHVCRETLREFDAFPESAAQARQLTSLGDRPLVVLSVVPEAATLESLPDEASREAARAAIEQTLALQAELAALSTRGRLVQVENDGEYLQIDQPEVVIQAVLEVVEGR